MARGHRRRTPRLRRGAGRGRRRGRLRRRRLEPRRDQGGRRLEGPQRSTRRPAVGRGDVRVATVALIAVAVLALLLAVLFGALLEMYRDVRQLRDALGILDRPLAVEI